MRKSTKALTSALAICLNLAVVGSALAATSSDNAGAAAGASVLGAMGLFWCCYGLMMIFIVFLAIFQLFMMYDAAMREKSDYPNDNKSTWIILLILIQMWAAVFYYFMVKRKAGKRQTYTPPPPAA
jgi:hypothetical protein